MRIYLMAAFFAIVMLLAACQTDDTGMGNEDGQTNYEQTRYNDTNNQDGRGQGFQMNNSRNGNGVQDRIHRGTDANDDDFGIGNQQDNFEMAEGIAERIVNNVDGVEDANVMTDGQNAYVAVDLGSNRNTDGNENGVGQQLNDQITDIVQTSSNRVDDVYITANPDFAGSLNDYAESIDNGEPVEGLFEEMNDMIRRVFPDHENSN
ncbi:YhcN/YlaJ family sporulation lipoprotein [Allobacillus sp. SKP2-8]|uniref:YhcN/YlaJ family sporulation lipoprotein n=1 Tax=unclassified Allobacillus TaxID=2628859 RepID=UPI001183F05C|nr:YhcN/YlaJ family sporulation lipoprotein [Allobacillus sp. SKP2-8]TSJ66313.1 YhcN/YlaJ family sporulation lipoprotein [Allobacillus sp. SKP2-8]